MTMANWFTTKAKQGRGHDDGFFLVNNVSFVLDFFHKIEFK